MSEFYKLGRIQIGKIKCCSMKTGMLTTKSETKRRQEQIVKNYCKIIANRLKQTGYIEGTPFLAERFQKKRLTFQGFLAVKNERVFKFVYRIGEGSPFWGVRELEAIVSKTMLKEIAFANLTVFDSKTNLGATNYMALKRPLKKEEQKVEKNNISIDRKLDAIKSKLIKKGYRRGDVVRADEHLFVINEDGVMLSDPTTRAESWYIDDVYTALIIEGQDAVQFTDGSTVKNFWKSVAPASDNIYHPSHYEGNIECMDAMLEVYGKDATMNFCLGNAFKYLWRCCKKGKKLEDLKKASNYLNFYINLAEKKKWKEGIK